MSEIRQHPGRMPREPKREGELTIALVGNPNCGKTTIFNLMTGAHQKVGNWSGVTVEKKTGHFNHAGQRINVIDLPGTYSLQVGHESTSIDQQIAQDFLLDGQADLLVNIIDASSFERGLFLTTQLIDAGLPVVIALNMMDVADQHGMHIDPYKLTAELGCPVVPLIATKGEGKGILIDVILNHTHSDDLKVKTPVLSTPVEEAISDIIQLGRLEKRNMCRLLACALLEREPKALGRFSPELQERMEVVTRHLESAIAVSVSDQLTADRYRWIAGVTSHAVHQESIKRLTITDVLDRILLNRFLAFPMFLGVMYLMFLITINVGGAFIDVFDITAGVLFVEIPRLAMEAVQLPAWLIALIANGVGGGVQLVASFIPVIATLFLFQTFLEDSGYMARAAFILDRMMRSVGLPGKSFIPLVVGFGCNVPAVMSARTLDTQQDRLLTIMMAPFMSCGARLTVYILFAAAFFQTNGQNVVFGLYIIGMAMAILTGLILRRKVLKSSITPFLLEMPNYHVPTFRGLMVHTWHRLSGFVTRAGKAIVLIVIALNFINSMGTDGSFGNENSEKSVLSQIGKTITPLFEPMGVKEENWPATVGIFTGIFAKEVVVGTLDSLYSTMALEQSGESLEEVSPLWVQLKEGFATVPENLVAIADSLGDPLGIGISDNTDLAVAAADQAVEITTLTIMPQLFVGALGAFCYLLFVLLYMPCVATLAAIYKESGRFWAIFSAAWNTIMAYALAVLIFQIGTFGTHPSSAVFWIVAMLGLIVVSYRVLLWYARREAQQSNLIPVINLH